MPKKGFVKQEQVTLGDFLALPVRTYSSGMLTRLTFAVATSVDPDILLMMLTAATLSFFGIQTWDLAQRLTPLKLIFALLLFCLSVIVRRHSCEFSVASNQSSARTNRC